MIDRRKQDILKKNSRLFKQLGIPLLMLFLTRIVFYVANQTAFSNSKILDFFSGIWMDLITIGLYFIPFYTLSVLPVSFYNTKPYQILLKTIFHITNGVVIALNLIDVEYFKYTGKRSTADLFSMATEENNLGELIGAFLRDFWWILILFIALIFISNWLYNKTIKSFETKYNFFIETLNFVVIVAILFIVGRGGFGLRPADMLTAARLSTPQKVPLVANTPLSIIKTFGKEPLEDKNYFPKDSDALYSPIHHGSTIHKIREQPNIMIIILESFGNEWLGKKNGKLYTPFLDSLLNHSIYFENGFANGKKSIEAVPSIFASIPGLIDNPYISSNYGTNSILALPQLLEELGYSSAFFHGATNGSMNFDVFSAQLGFQSYYGRKEFNNEDLCDANWGALDEYFLPWTAESMTEVLTEPFLSSLFTLSSHHPYYVPEIYRNTLPEGEHPMAQSIAYTDMSLRLFFDKAKEQPWYKNTVFIITADHTPAGNSPYFKSFTGLFNIPIAIFDPLDNQGKVESEIFSHIDIMPTVLDIVGYPNDVYSFGQSYFKPNRNPFSISYISNSYLYFKDDYMLNFIDNRVDGLYNFKLDSLTQYDSSAYYPEYTKNLDNEVKGFIQRFNHDLIHNQMKIKP